MSCDKYSWLWKGWYHHFKKHWEIEIPVYFVSENLNPGWDGISSIRVGSGLTWSEGLKVALESLPKSHGSRDLVFFSLEDYWPIKTMGLQEFCKIYAKFYGMDLLCLRCSHPCSFYILKDDGRLSEKSKYLISCQTSLWDVEYLISCIDPKENPWEFEVKGTERVRKRGLAHRTAFYPLPWYEHVCVRGKLTDEGEILTFRITPQE